MGAHTIMMGREGRAITLLERRTEAVNARDCGERWVSVG
jgi:hypothetical protein